MYLMLGVRDRVEYRYYIIERPNYQYYYSATSTYWSSTLRKNIGDGMHGS
jgi:hypothetical protein